MSILGRVEATDSGDAKCVRASTAPRGFSSRWLIDAADSPRAVAVFAALVAFVYLAGVTGLWWPTPDSAVYIGLGRSISSGAGYRFNGSVSATFPPGLPLILAALQRLGGPSFWLPNLFVAICGLAALVMIHGTLRLLSADPQLALGAVLVTAFSYTFYAGAHRILSDVPFALAFWCLFYCLLRSVRNNPAWLGLALPLTACAVLIRAPGILLVVPLALGVILDGLRREPATSQGPGEGIHLALPAGGRMALRLIAALSTIAAGAAVAYVLYCLARSVGPSQPRYLTLVMGEGGRTLAERVSSRLARGFAEAPTALADAIMDVSRSRLVGLSMLALVCIGTVRLWTSGSRAAVTSITLYPLALIICLGRFGMTPRYLLPILPIVALTVLLASRCVVGFVAALRHRPAGPDAARWAVAFVTVACIALNAPRTGRWAFYYSVMSHTSRYYEVIRDGDYRDVFLAADTIRRESRPGAKVATEATTAPILYVVTDCLTLPVPETPRNRPADADRVVAFVVSHPEVDLVFAETSGTGPEYSASLAHLLETTLSMRPIYQGRYTLYGRDAPARKDE